MSVGPDSYAALARDIRGLLEIQGYSLRELGRRTHYSPSTLSEALNAKSRMTPSMARVLAAVLGVRPDDWVERAMRLRGVPFAAPDRTIHSVPRRPTRPTADRELRVGLDSGVFSAGEVASGRVAGRPRQSNGLMISGDDDAVNFAPNWAPPPPDPTKSRTTEEFNDCLHRLWSWAGRPSMRKLEDISRGDLRRATVNDMLRRTDRLPKRDLLMSFVSACGASSEWPWWNQAWQAVHANSRRI